MRYGPGDRLPDPSWKSGPPDPEPWRVHEHEFWEPHTVETDGENIYAHYRCAVDDGHPHDPQHCETTQTMVYVPKTVEQVRGLARGEVDYRHEPEVWAQVVEKAAELASENPFAYDVGEPEDITVMLRHRGEDFDVTFEHDETRVEPW